MVRLSAVFMLELNGPGRRLFHCFFLLFINFMLATLSHSASDADKQICNALLENNRCLYEDMTSFWVSDRTLDDVLLYITVFDRANLMQQYVNLGGDPNRIGRHNVAQGYSGYPLLVSAARYGSPGVLRVLLCAGANINAVVEPGTDHGRDGGKSALHACVGFDDYGSRECVRLLLKTGMNRNIRDEHRRTALQHFFLILVAQGSGTQPIMMAYVLLRWVDDIAAMGGNFERRRWIEIFQTLIIPEYSAHFNFYAMCQEFMRLHDEKRKEDFFPWMQDRVREVIAPESRDYFDQNLLNPSVPIAQLFTGIVLRRLPSNPATDSFALLLNDEGTDIAVQDENGDTVIHIASRRENLALFRVLASCTRITPEILAVTNNGGESVGDCIHRARTALAAMDQARARADAAEEQRAAEERRATRNTILGGLLVSAVVTAAVGGITWWWLAHRRPASLGPRRI
jgi:ankyrin repeat protein